MCPQRKISHLLIETHPKYNPSHYNAKAEVLLHLHLVAKASLYPNACPHACSSDFVPTQPADKYTQDIQTMVTPSIHNWERPKRPTNGPHWAARPCNISRASKANAVRTAFELAVGMHRVSVFTGPPISRIYSPCQDAGNNRTSLAWPSLIKLINRVPWPEQSTHYNQGIVHSIVWCFAVRMHDSLTFVRTRAGRRSVVAFSVHKCA